MPLLQLNNKSMIDEERQSAVAAAAPEFTQQQQQQQWSDYGICILLCLLSFITIAGNCLIILSLLRERQLRTVQNCLLASLAVADLLMGAVVMPFGIVLFLRQQRWPFGELWCDLWMATDVLSSTASILNICVIGFDRYWAVENPMMYPQRMTQHRCCVMVSIVWLCSLAISFPAILWWRAVKPAEQAADVCRFTENKTYLLLSSLVSFYIPLCLMIAIYARIYRTARQMNRSLLRGNKVVLPVLGHSAAASSSITLGVHRGGGGAAGVRQLNHAYHHVHFSQRRNRLWGTTTTPASAAAVSSWGFHRWKRFSNEQRAAKTLGIVMGVFIACWLPFFTGNLCISLGRDSVSQHMPIIMTVFTWLGYANSMANPIIYAFSMKEFYKSFVKIACPCWAQRLLRNVEVNRAMLQRTLMAQMSEHGRGGGQGGGGSSGAVPSPFSDSGAVTEAVATTIMESKSDLLPGVISIETENNVMTTQPPTLDKHSAAFEVSMTTCL